MALLIDRATLGRDDGVIAPDLSDKMNDMKAEQIYGEPDLSFDLEQIRHWIQEYSALAARGVEIEGVATSDGTLPGSGPRIFARFYNPEARGATLLFVHGGGWVMGGVKSHDHIARWLAAEIGARVIQIDYSLAPEHPYPAALNEIIAALSSVLAEAAGAPVFVAGDSAGANLAACAILRLSKDERSQLAGFISIYGAYAPEMNFSSHRLYGDGRFGLSEPQMRWFWNLYAPQLPPETRARALSPLTADLSDFPPTLCIGAECDLLLDDTLAFYGELTKVGVDVSLSLWSGLPHGCLHFVAAVRSVTEAAGSIVQFVRSRTIAHPSKPLRTDRPPAAPPAPEIARPELIDVEPVVASGRSRLHGTLAHRIAGDIIRDVLPPGVLLPREESAGEAFGVSRSVYREALRTLAAKGLVTSQPKVGSRVAPRSSWHVLDPSLLEWRFEIAPTEPFIRDLFELRKIVEPSAAALAAMRRQDQDVSRLADALSRMASTNPRAGAWLNAIVAFHHELLVSGRNEALYALWPAIQTTLRWSIRLQTMLPTLTLAHDPVADHARVFEKITSQNASGALTETALLIDAALSDTLTNMQRLGASEGAEGAASLTQ